MLRAHSSCFELVSSMETDNFLQPRRSHPLPLARSTLDCFTNTFSDGCYNVSFAIEYPHDSASPPGSHRPDIQ